MLLPISRLINTAKSYLQLQLYFKKLQPKYENTYDEISI